MIVGSCCFTDRQPLMNQGGLSWRSLILHENLVWPVILRVAQDQLFRASTLFVEMLNPAPRRINMDIAQPFPAKRVMTYRPTCFVAVVLFVCLIARVTDSIGQEPVRSPEKTRPSEKRSASSSADAGQSKAKARADASDAFFASAAVVNLKVEIAPAELEKLRENNRAYVRCNIVENDRVTYKSVAIKLKGAAGSFREFDDRPALTLNVDKFNKDQDFHGIEKFHLNNSVQDESYLNEMLCSDLCQKMKIPATRVTHARVWLNGRDVGLYVLKEGFDSRFLKRHFSDAKGNLYDGGFLQDVDVDLEKDSGIGPDDRSDLHALREACREIDPVIRWQRIVTILDVDRFIDFMALELMTGHWDGYTVNKNNYRIYFDSKSKKAHFLPHGMDQMFGDAGFSVLNQPGCIVSSAVMLNPAWRKRYRARLKEFLPLFNPADRMLALVDAQEARLAPVIKAINVDQANGFRDRINELKQRLIARAENLAEQVATPEPGPLEFSDAGVAELPDWYGASESEDAIHEEVEVEGQPGRQCYSIQVGPSGRCVASWRRKVLLLKGRYLFEATAMTEKLQAATDDRGSGVGLRISGVQREGKLDGTQRWTPLKFEFEVTEEQREVELVAEIRATAGRVWFEKSSLILRQIK